MTNNVDATVTFTRTKTDVTKTVASVFLHFPSPSLLSPFLLLSLSLALLNPACALPGFVTLCSPC